MRLTAVWEADALIDISKVMEEGETELGIFCMLVLLCGHVLSKLLWVICDSLTVLFGSPFSFGRLLVWLSFMEGVQMVTCTPGF